LRALGSDQIARLEGYLRSRRTIGQHAGDRTRPLAERSQLGVEAQRSRSTCFLRKSTNDRFKVILSTETIPDGRRCHILRGSATGHAALDLLAGKGLGPDDQPQPSFRQSCVPDRGIDAALPEDFHGTGIDPTRFWRECRARVTFDKQRAHTVPGEQQ